MDTNKIYAEKIASEYAPKETSKVTALKKLDKKARMPAQVFAYVFGIIATLIVGVGMCLSMNVFNVDGKWMMPVGVVVGIVGIALMSVNYPIYKRISEKGKQKYAADIIELAKQISEEE